MKKLGIILTTLTFVFALSATAQTAKTPVNKPAKQEVATIQKTEKKAATSVQKKDTATMKAAKCQKSTNKAKAQGLKK
ncbi:MAG TPA: hypothetical protein PK903_04785 [Paludibacteraceae bacterium]|jgi:biopolymer transport protein ExbD|nr:hypothetical protein [Paludibacteraceae bacterium]